MISLKQLLKLTDSLGIPAAQIQWAPTEAPKLPYIVLVPQNTDNVFADGITYQDVTPYLVELYSRRRDVALEKRVQAAFDANGVAWDRYHTTDENGPVVIAVYKINVIEN